MYSYDYTPRRVCPRNIHIELSDDGKVGTSGRWDKEYCTFFGLGYSPRTGNKLVQYAVKKGLRLDILEKTYG